MLFKLFIDILFNIIILLFELIRLLLFLDVFCFLKILFFNFFLKLRQLSLPLLIFAGSVLMTLLLDIVLLIELVFVLALVSFILPKLFKLIFKLFILLPNFLGKELFEL